MAYIEYLAIPYQYMQNPYAILLIIPIIIVLKLLIRKTFNKVKPEEEDPKDVKRRKLLKRFVFYSRCLIFLLLLLAIASPFVERETLIDGDPFIRIIIDNSTSFSLFDTSVGEELRRQIGSEIRVEPRYVGDDDKTALGDAVLSSLQDEGNILLVSDGNNNFGADLGDVALYASKLNATIHAINLQPEHTDVRVSIIGQPKTFEEKEEIYTVKVEGVGGLPEYRLRVTLDGQDILDTVSNAARHDIKRTFAGGYHQLEAEITVAGEDYFPQNNKFYKTIKVVPKPKLLFVTQLNSPHEILFAQVYDVQRKESLPSDLSEYYAVALNNLNIDKFDDKDIERLVEYVSDGNGLFVIGGSSAYEQGGYKDSKLETLLLPVFVASPGKEEGDVNVVMVIDVSGSTGQSVGGDAAVDIEKAQAISIFNDLKPNNRFGVVAFNRLGHVIEPMSRIDEKTNVAEKIAKLRDGGGTLISSGLFTALELLKPTDGSKNIILISDGITQLLSQAEETAQLAATLGVKIYTVGVGPRTNDFIMQRIAQIGGGIYFKADQSSRLKILFGDPEAADKSRYAVTVLDSNHPVTTNLEDIRAVITGYNQVVPKTTANLLASTDIGDPLLTVSRFGLGRIGAWTTDDGTAWSGSTLSQNASPLLISAMGWLVGDPERKAENFVDVSDTRLQEPTFLFVKSPTPPKGNDIVFFKLEEDLYKATISPQDLGFQRIVDATFAVNYKREFDEVGIHPELTDTVQITGGKMFNPDQIDDIVESVKSRAKRSLVKKVYIHWPFIVLAMILLLLEIAVRKLLKSSKKG